MGRRRAEGLNHPPPASRNGARVREEGCDGYGASRGSRTRGSTPPDLWTGRNGWPETLYRLCVINPRGVTRGGGAKNAEPPQAHAPGSFQPRRLVAQPFGVCARRLGPRAELGGGTLGGDEVIDLEQRSNVFRVHRPAGHLVRFSSASLLAENEMQPRYRGCSTTRGPWADSGPSPAYIVSVMRDRRGSGEIGPGRLKPRQRRREASQTAAARSVLPPGLFIPRSATPVRAAGVAEHV